MRLPWITIALVSAAGGLACLPAAAPLLQFDRAMAGQPWRLLTCQLTHFGSDHLLWDAGAVLLLGGLCELLSPRRFRLCLMASLGLIPAAVGLLLPGMQVFRGLSGIASALFALLAARLLPRFRAGALACLGLLAAKTAFEALTGSCLFADGAAAGFSPVPLAHAAGLAVGLAVGSLRLGELVPEGPGR